MRACGVSASPHKQTFHSDARDLILRVRALDRPVTPADNFMRRVRLLERRVTLGEVSTFTRWMRRFRSAIEVPSPMEFV